jgi:hypothetical protein
VWECINNFYWGSRDFESTSEKSDGAEERCGSENQTLSLSDGKYNIKTPRLTHHFHLFNASGFPDFTNFTVRLFVLTAFAMRTLVLLSRLAQLSCAVMSLSLMYR